MKVEATPEQDAMVQAFARAIEQAGGKALLVGGLVRDEILGLPSKDFDFEVFGLPMERVQAILQRFGNVKEVGQQFGVLNIQELDWDVALPRREQKTGEGHKGFDVVPDPTMSVEDAARRRDLTINALSKDPLTGEIIDPLNGMADLKAGILRMADPNTFGDDPLRALRVAQFAARFDFDVEPETLKVVAAQPLEQLPGERILPEFSKMLLKGQKPSKGIEVLRQANLLRYFPEIEALQGVPQEPKWHPEGDVYVHTMMVLDEAGKQRTGDPEFDLPLMLGALAHDFGKPTNTEEIDGKITSRGHEEAGVAPTNAFMSRMKAPLALTKQVETLVSFHLRPAILPNTGGGRKGYRKLGRELDDGGVSPELLAAMSKADVLGRTTEAALRRDVSSQDKFLEEYNEHVTSQAAPGGKLVDSVSGKHLIAKGFKPGPEMGKFLALTRSIEDETGVTDPDKLIELATRFLKDRSEGGGSQEGNENDCGDSHIREGEECFDGDYREQRKKGNTKSTLATDLDWTQARPCGNEEAYPDKCGQDGAQTAFTPPNFEEEYEEATRYPHLAGKTPEEWNQIAQTGQSVKWSDLEKAGPIGNHDNPEDFGSLDEDKQGRFNQSMDSGQVEMPIVIRTPEGGLDLLGGNTRQAGLRAAGVDPEVWFVDTSQITADFFDWTIGRPCEDGHEEYPEKCTGPGSSAENPSGPHDAPAPKPRIKPKPPVTPEDHLKRAYEQQQQRPEEDPFAPAPPEREAEPGAWDMPEPEKQSDPNFQPGVDPLELEDTEPKMGPGQFPDDAWDMPPSDKEKLQKEKDIDRAGKELDQEGNKAHKEALKKAKELEKRQKLSQREAVKKEKEFQRNRKLQEKEAEKAKKLAEKEQALKLREEQKAEKLAEKEQAQKLKEEQKAQQLAEKEQAQKLKQAEMEYQKYMTGDPKSKVPQGLDFEGWLEYVLMGPEGEKTNSAMGPSAFRTHPDKTQPDFLLWEKFDMPANQKGTSLHPGLASVALGDYTASVTAEPQRLHERTNKYPGVKDFDRGSRFSEHPLEGPLGRDGFGGSTPGLMEELEPRQNGQTPETGIFPDWDEEPAEAHEAPLRKAGYNKQPGFLDKGLPFPEMPETSTPHPSPTRAEPAPPSSFPGQVVRKPGGGGLDRAPMMRPNGKPSGTGFLPVQSPPEPESNMFKADLLPGGKGDDIPDTQFDPFDLKQGTDTEQEEHGLDPERAKEVAKDHLVEDPDAYAEGFSPDQVHGPGGNNPGGTLNDQGRSGRGGGTKRRDYWDMDYTGKKSGFQSIEPPETNIYPAATEAARTMEDLMDIEVIHPHDYNPDWKGGGVSMGPSIKHQNTRKTHDQGLDPFPKGFGPDGEVLEGADDDANIEQKQVQPLIPNQKMAIAVDPNGPMGERIVIMSPLFEEASPAIMALRSHRFERHGGVVIDGPPEWLLGITPRLEALDKSSGHDGADDLYNRVLQLIQSAGMPVEYEQQPRP